MCMLRGPGGCLRGMPGTSCSSYESPGPEMCPERRPARRQGWPQLLATVVVLLALLPSTAALRLPSWASLLPWHSRQPSPARQEEVLRQVLSPRSQPNQHLLALSQAQPASDEALLPPQQPSLRDPVVQTVFAEAAERRFPRLGTQPRVILPPQLVDPDAALPKPGAAATASASANPSHTSQSLPADHDREAGRGRVGEADPPAPDLDLGEALLAATFASISYCSRPDLLAAWNCTRCGLLRDFQPSRIVYDAVWDLVSYIGYYPPWKAVVMSFR
jgi:hypothetical protein